MWSIYPKTVFSANFSMGEGGICRKIHPWLYEDTPKQFSYRKMWSIFLKTAFSAHFSRGGRNLSEYTPIYEDTPKQFSDKHAPFFCSLKFEIVEPLTLQF